MQLQPAVVSIIQKEQTVRAGGSGKHGGKCGHKRGASGVGKVVVSGKRIYTYLFSNIVKPLATLEKSLTVLTQQKNVRMTMLPDSSLKQVQFPLALLA